jgi:hypothetical protein
MIKKYNQFLKESKDDLDLRDAIEKSNYSSYSYSSMCKTNADPDEDFNEMQSELDELGWSLKRIREEYTDNDLISLYREMDSISGSIDIYFYKLFEKFELDRDIVRLGGVGWDDINVTDDEAFIRYSYGYHNTEYGILAINQIDGGLDEFLKQAFRYLKTWILDEIPIRVLGIYVKNNINFDKLTGIQMNWNSNQVLDIDKYSLVEEDRMIIDAERISNHLNNILTKDGEKLSNYYRITSVDIYNTVVDMLEKYLEIDDIVFTGSDIIIWNEFEEEY